MAADGEPRQAVVVIHGIGEQKPMKTLRAFVDTLFDAWLGATPRPSWWERVNGRRRHPEQEPPPRFFSKPDRLTDTLELRRLSSRPPNVPIQTDFYELYWAHLMQGTVWSHIVAWLRVLMFRVPIGAHVRVKLMWVASWGAFAAIAYLAFQNRLTFSTPEFLGYGAAGVLAWVVIRALGGLGLSYVGDAARYLSPRPQNIDARKNIRNAVIQLLTKLHEESPIRYGRIIVVGHSLGSVIAYDALTHLWQQRHSTIAKPRPFDQPKMETVRKAGTSLDEAAVNPTAASATVDCLLDKYRIAQRELLAEQQELGVNWRISDLVTLGSPLAHACFLLADDRLEWQDLLHQRVYPTSPPQLEDPRDENQLTKHFAFTDANNFKLMILHHAALFACTRWTNLYFPSDPIGGKVAGSKNFGYGIKDVPLVPIGWLTNWAPVSHTRYWDRSETEAVRALWEALDLADSARPATSVRVESAPELTPTFERSRPNISD